MTHHQRVAGPDVEASESARASAELRLAVDGQAALAALPDDQNAVQLPVQQRSRAPQNQRPAAQIKPGKREFRVETRPASWIPKEEVRIKI